MSGSFRLKKTVFALLQDYANFFFGGHKKKKKNFFGEGMRKKLLRIFGKWDHPSRILSTNQNAGI